MSLTEEEAERYCRQIALPGVGIRGQERLLKGSVLVIGAGGLGSPAALYLAAAGVGTLGVVDADAVELSNLQRQILHTSADLGAPKVASAGAALAALNPGVNVALYHEKAGAKTIVDIINDRRYDFVIDATDNFPSKFLINDACVLLEKPFSHGEVLAFGGQILTYVPGKGPCYRCVFGDSPSEGEMPSDGESPAILGAVCGVIGSLQAAEALKFLLGAGNFCGGFLLSYDALRPEFRTVKLEPNKKCPVCGDNRLIKDLRAFA